MAHSQIKFSAGCCCEEPCPAILLGCAWAWDNTYLSYDGPDDVYIDLGATGFLSNTVNCDACTSVGGELNFDISDFGSTCVWTINDLWNCDGCFLTNETPEAGPQNHFGFGVTLRMKTQYSTPSQVRWEFTVEAGHGPVIDPLEDEACDCDTPSYLATYYSAWKCRAENFRWPITLTKQDSDNWCPECTGTFPATITLNETV